MKIVKTLRTHWKKSVFLFGVSTLGARYGYNRYHEHLLTKQYAFKLRHFSEERAKPEQPMRTVVVFVNPKADGGRAMKTFNRVVKPLLNFTGINFLVVPTAYEGHVASLIQYLPSGTSGIVVAGGDGMLQDSVTSILRDNRAKGIPIGYIPLGGNNSFCERYLSLNDTARRLDKVYQAVYHVVSNTTMAVPIMEIRPDEGRSIYGLSYFTWGTAKNILDTVPSFWWLGSYLSTLAASIRFAVRSSWPPEISYQLNDEEHRSSNLTILPRGSQLHLYESPPISSRMAFLKDFGLFLHSYRQSCLTEKLTHGNSIISRRVPDISSKGEKEQTKEKSEDEEEEENANLVSKYNDSCYYIDELTIRPRGIPSHDHVFFVDGEELDARNIKVSITEDKLRMFHCGSDAAASFVPEQVRVLPALPSAVMRLLGFV